jgi:polyisoprenoid-binding protein YceI
MGKLPTTLILFALLLAAPFARADTVDYKKSRVAFTFKQMNVPVEGSFPKFTANVAFDAANPQKGRAEIEVDLGSIDTGSADGDTEAKRKPWFNVESFPKARFVSTAVQPLGPDRLQVSGTLTIKGRTREMTVPVSMKHYPAGTAYEGTFSLPRLQFGIGEGPWADTETVADEVQVRFRIFVSSAQSASPPQQK